MTDDVQLEARLRDTLRARDPGAVAPAGLRERIARAPQSRAGIGPRALRPARAAGAILATAAAVVLGVLGVGALRDLLTEGGPGSGPLPSVTGVPSAAHPAGPLPLTLEGWIYSAVLVAVIVIVWFIAEALTAPPGTTEAGSVTPWRFPRGLGWLHGAAIRRVVFLVALAGAIAYPAGVSAMSHASEGSYGGYSSVGLLGGRTSYGSQPSILFYIGQQTGATITTGFSIRNDGVVPMTILGLDPENGEHSELRRLANEDPNVGPAVDTAPTVGFSPFELRPGEERYLIFIDQDASCPGAQTPVAPGLPHPNPSPDLQNYQPPVGSTEFSIDAVPIRVSALGVGSTTWIPLTWSLIVVC